MKRTLLLSFISLLPLSASAQDSINPYSIQQKGNIILQNTDVYYKPFGPPDSTDTRAELCNEAQMLLDSDGIAWNYPTYAAMTHGVLLENWAPYGGDSLGKFVVWQRLFQGDTITVGSNVTNDTTRTHGYGPVIISKNEDVDFRAKHLIKLKSGFHVMPGAFFHAYTEPKWDTAVFSDEFDDSAKFRNQWHVSNGWGGNYYPEGTQCVYDSNARLVTDTDAHDGHALDLIIREDTVDTCSCTVLTQAYKDSCGNTLPSADSTVKFIFSAGVIRSCPFPFTQKVDTPFASAYAHAPYGKYEIREKIPHIQHHTNNWGGGFTYGFEYDLNETDWNGNMGIIQPDFNHSLWRGPFKGVFAKLSGTVIFISSQPEWCLSNNPATIVINNVPYQVQFIPGHGMDTVAASGFMQYSNWPVSLANSTDSFSFYYSYNDGCIADKLPWHVDSTGRIFSAGYHINRAGDTLRFSKANQPTSVTLRDSIDPHGDTISETHNCHWEYNLNPPHGTGDSGILYLDQALDSSDLHSNVEAYGFHASDLYSDPGYPIPPVPFNTDDTTPGSYQYHTFAMELLPHEVRILVDSVVVRRLPDRLIPFGSPYYDWITTLPRTLTDIRPAEIDIDPPSNTHTDPFGTDTTTTTWMGITTDNSITYQERKYFEHAASIPGWPGFETVDGKQVAHHMIDYIKVWDVPKDVIIPDLPH